MKHTFLKRGWRRWLHESQINLGFLHLRGRTYQPRRWRAYGLVNAR